jgi:hypothetical protein
MSAPGRWGAAVRGVRRLRPKRGILGTGLPEVRGPVSDRDRGEVFTDGPFVESKEYLAGFWIMEAPDLDVALKLAAEGSRACNRKVEVRPILGE